MISSYYSIFVQTVALSPWQSLSGEPSTKEKFNKAMFSRRGRSIATKNIRKKKEYKLLAKVQIHSSASKILL
jgi:ABC-type oligopeptide transport system ATPase subunit